MKTEATPRRAESERRRHDGPGRYALLLGVALALITTVACGRSSPVPGEAPLETSTLITDPELELGAQQVFMATVSRGGRPVSGATVTISVFLPQGGVRWYIGPPTSAEGRTTIRFKPAQTGAYYVEVTTLDAGDVFNGSTGFRVRPRPEE